MPVNMVKFSTNVVSCIQRTPCKLSRHWSQGGFHKELNGHLKKNQTHVDSTVKTVYIVSIP